MLWNKQAARIGVIFQSFSSTLSASCLHGHPVSFPKIQGFSIFFWEAIFATCVEQFTLWAEKCPFCFSYGILPASGCRLTCRESTTFTIASIGLVLGRFVRPHFRLCFWGTVDYHCFVGAKVQRLNSVVFSTAGGKHGPDLHKQSLELTNSHWNSSII